MENILVDKLSINPIIAAINSKNKGLAVNSASDVVFILSGTIFDLKEFVGELHSNEKVVFLHFDLIEGISKDSVGLRYISEKVKPDGIISTRANMIKLAKQMGLLTIQRIFILDSLSLETGISSVKENNPTAIEIMPGALPKITKIICERTKLPVITGGLISDKDDIVSSLKAGAIGVSTSKSVLWDL